MAINFVYQAGRISRSINPCVQPVYSAMFTRWGKSNLPRWISAKRYRISFIGYWAHRVIRGTSQDYIRTSEKGRRGRWRSFPTENSEYHSDQVMEFRSSAFKSSTSISGCSCAHSKHPQIKQLVAVKSAAKGNMPDRHAEFTHHCNQGVMARACAHHVHLYCSTTPGLRDPSARNASHSGTDSDAPCQGLAW